MNSSSDQPVNAMAPIDQWFVSLSGWHDLDASRQTIFAFVALMVFLFTAPRGRRWLARWPAALLLLAPVPLGCTALFPDAVAGIRLASLAVQFLVLSSALQSVLLTVTVSCWERISGPIPKIFLDVLRLFVVLLALLAVLWESGVEAGELFAGSAVLTAVLGFALKDTLGNVFAGLAIHAEHPFELGDWIQYDTNTAHIGKVVEINWRATKVITLDQAYVIVPNSQLAQASIRNFTKPDPWSRRSLFVVTPYDISPQKVQSIILEAIRGSFGVLEYPPPSVVTNEFKERGVEHWVRLFTTEFDKRDKVDGMARDRIWYALARCGIEIPVATQAIRLTQPVLPSTQSVELSMDRRVERLEKIGLLEPFGPEQVRQLAEVSDERMYAAGEAIIHQGDAGESMFVVFDGRVEVTVSEPGTGPVVIRTLEGGDFFGEMSLMTGSPRVATVTAVIESRVLELSKESFRIILATQPSLIGELGVALQIRLAERAQAIAGVERVIPTPHILKTIRDFFGISET